MSHPVPGHDYGEETMIDRKELFTQLRAKAAQGIKLTPEEEIFLDTGKIYFNLEKAIEQTSNLTK